MRSFRFHHALILTTSLLMPIGSIALAGDRIETENYDLLPDGGFQNPFFLHDLQPHEFDGGSTPEQGFQGANPDSDSGMFFHVIVSGTDFITFVLAENEYVDFASVFMNSSLQFSPSTFHVIGVDINEQRLELIIDSSSGTDFNQWVKVDSSGAPFARITEIRLSGLAKGFFDDLTVNVTPEPATWVLMGIGAGGLVLLRRRSAGR